MISILDAAANLRGKKWRFGAQFGVVPDDSRGVTVDSAHIGGHAADEAEGINIGGRKDLRAFIPRSVGIAAAIGGQEKIFRNHGIVPASYGIQGHIKTAVDGQALERSQMLAPFSRTMRRILVLDLDADNRPAVFPKQPMKLLPDLRIEQFYFGKINGIIGAHRALAEHPVRQSAVANLSMGPGTDARIQQHSMLGAQFGKFSQITLAAPIKLTFNLFVMNPEDVG